MRLLHRQRRFLTIKILILNLTVTGAELSSTSKRIVRAGYPHTHEHIVIMPLSHSVSSDVSLCPSCRAFLI